MDRGWRPLIHAIAEVLQLKKRHNRRRFMHAQNRRHVIALVATPNFKNRNRVDLCRFVFGHLYPLTERFEVISTGNTYSKISELVNHVDISREYLDLLKQNFPASVSEAMALQMLRRSMSDYFKTRKSGLPGMIEIANDLVQGNVDAVIQLSVDDDLTLRAGSAVLQRQANVHNVPIAGNIGMAQSFVEFWKKRVGSGLITRPLNTSNKYAQVFFDRTCHSPLEDVVVDEGDDVLAIISHDGRKNEMCRFLIENADTLRRFKHILATRNSGELAKKCLGSAKWSPEDLSRVLCCKSGPEGGDVEIAAAVVKGLCRNVIFFQDPATSHPHHSDIRLFEQAVLIATRVRLASNGELARILLETL